MKANYEEKRWHGRVIKPGQFVTSRAVLSKETGISEQSVRTSITRLKSTGEITSESTSGYTIITVVNWAKFQCSEENLTNESTSESTSGQPATNQQLTTTKEIKNIRNKEYNILSSETEAVSDKEKPLVGFGHDSKQYKASKYLDRKICERIPVKKHLSEKQLQRWAADIDKLNRLDGQSWENISKVLSFSQKDPFWQSVILSATNFRKQYVQIYAKMQKGEDNA